MPIWIKQEKLKIVRFRSIFEVFKVLICARNDDVIITNSLRFIDMIVIRCFFKRGLRNINFQHGINDYFAVKTLGALFKKLINLNYYSEFMVILLLLTFEKASWSRCKTKDVLFIYFTSRHRFNFRTFAKKYINYKVIEIPVSVPSPLIWGTKEEIKQMGYCDIFIIDELFENTYGISPKSIVKFITEMLHENKFLRVWVKLHPRREKNIYRELDDICNIQFVQHVPFRCSILVGAHSNLLQAPILHREFLLVKKNGFCKSVLQSYESLSDIQLDDIDIFHFIELP